MSNSTSLACGLFFLALTVGANVANDASAGDHPNLVFIIADDLGAGDTGFMGNTDVRTPALDGLAARSVALERVFVASPSCAPSRGALLSGLMPFRNGAEPNHTQVRDDVRQLPRYMKELGYEVASIGKITHGTDKRTGFDYDNRNISLEKIEMVSDYLASRESTKPLLLMVGIKDPHVPWPKKYFPHYDPAKLTMHSQLVDTAETRVELARYYSDVERMDLQVAATLKAVEQHLGPETIIFFTSDHGAQLPYGKWNNYDYSVRAPMLVCWPGVVRPGTRDTSLISFVDILPTLIDIAGGTSPSCGLGRNEIDGRSFLQLLRGATSHHRDHVFSTNSSAAHHTYPLRSVRTDQFRYIRNVYPELNFTTQTDHNPKGESHGMWQSWVRRAKFDPAIAEKLNLYHQRPEEELYDLRNDPHEQNNLAGDPAHAKTLESHRNLLDQWIEESGDMLQKHGKPMQGSAPLDNAHRNCNRCYLCLSPVAVWRTSEFPFDRCDETSTLAANLKIVDGSWIFPRNRAIGSVRHTDCCLKAMSKTRIGVCCCFFAVKELTERVEYAQDRWA